jgi:N-acetylglucosamine-6-sulfatase
MVNATRPRRARRRAALAASVMLACASASAWAPGAASPAAAKPPPRPNVVLVVTDDQATSTVRPETMPNLLRLVRPNATTFADAIVTTPLCCPSRASMLTGQYAHNHGVLRNDYRQLRDKRNTLPAWLDRAGYRTIHVGKFLNVYRKARGPESRPAPGWDVWQTIQEPNTYYDYVLSVNGRKVPYGSEPRDYLTDVLNRRAARIVRREGRRDRPFFLQLDHWAPHDDSRGGGFGPCSGGGDPVPAPRDVGRFAAEPLPEPRSFNEADVSDKPSFIRAQAPVDAGRVGQNYRCGLESLRAVDHGFAKLRRALRKTGELRKTVIVFVSDNGYFYGEHRLRFKVDPYEEALRVPLVISVPRKLRRGAQVPATISEPVANIDIPPTILELARAASCRRRSDCRTMDGRSLVPLLRGDRAGWPKDRALGVEYTGRNTGFSSCSYRGIRVAGELFVDHTLIPNFTTGGCEPGLEREHYDMRSDPFQLQNLYPAPASSPVAARQADLSERLASLQLCAGVAGRDPQTGTRPYCE